MFINVFINIIILSIEEKNMAFDNNQDKISNLLKSTDTTPKNSTNSNFEFEIKLRLYSIYNHACY